MISVMLKQSPRRAQCLNMEQVLVTNDRQDEHELLNKITE